MTPKKEPLPPKTCALEGCETEFVPGRTTQKYCNISHSRLATNRRQRSNAKAATPAEPIDAMVAEAQKRDIQRANALELKKLTAAEGRIRRYEGVLDEALRAYDPTPLLLERQVHSTDNPSEIEWVILLSDWHVGQKTTMEETGGLYTQDVATTRAQVAKLWRAVSLIHSIESAGRVIKKIHILSLGDLVENDNMRPSQHTKIEELLSVQTIQAFDLLTWFVRQCLTISEQVDVDFVGGNHDRLSQKAGDAGLAELGYTDTVSWLAGAFAERVLAEDIASGRLGIRNWTTFYGYKMIAGNKVVFEHGSSIKWGAGSYGGVPWYGVSNLGPRYETMLGGADVVCLGHGHRAAILPNGRNWVAVNGALPATSTYAQSGFKAVQRPLQWLLALHEEVGVADFQPLYADVPGTTLPGQIWEDPSKFADLASRKESPAR